MKGFPLWTHLHLPSLILPHFTVKVFHSFGTKSIHSYQTKFETFFFGESCSISSFFCCYYYTLPFCQFKHLLQNVNLSLRLKKVLHNSLWKNKLFFPQWNQHYWEKIKINQVNLHEDANLSWEWVSKSYALQNLMWHPNHSAFLTV